MCDKDGMFPAHIYAQIKFEIFSSIFKCIQTNSSIFKEICTYVIYMFTHSVHNINQNIFLAKTKILFLELKTTIPVCMTFNNFQ